MKYETRRRAGKAFLACLRPFGLCFRALMPSIESDIQHGDCLELLRDRADDSFDLIFTSPPYADRRARTYGGVKAEKDGEWVLPRAARILRVLRGSGRLVPNISGQMEGGERATEL